ncbi:hypothetical protein CK203_041858 [Vitis vinifera]|uniref:Uncharacterized protein n=1 Tax=Vitis vinifera TaxID=29760 RepID=A0A438FYE7_VITVI|nr:hypothetical protein CK203_041858 [Vitis vinifera]
MSSKKKAASSARVGDAYEKSTDKLSVKEFRDRFCIPNGEHFNAGPPVSSAALFKEFLHFTKIPPAFIHPISSGMSAHLPSLQLVTELPDSTKEGEGIRDGPGCMGGVEASGEALLPELFLRDSGPEKRGHLVDWVEKASFACLSNLFEIDAKERHYKTLLTARNLMAVVRESQEYVVNILPRKMPKEVVPGEHYTVKDLPIYQAFKEADAEKRRALLDNREKKKNEGTLRKAPDRNAAQTLLQIKLQRKEGSCCVHQPSGSPNPDADAAEAVCATLMEEAGAESQSQPSDDPDRLALVLVKGPPSKRPLGAQSEVRTHRAASRSSARDRTVPVMVPDEVAPGETHPAPFSYAELEDKLKQFPAAHLTSCLSQDVRDGGNAGEWSPRHGQQHDLFSDLLRTTDYMKIFASRQRK